MVRSYLFAAGAVARSAVEAGGYSHPCRGGYPLTRGATPGICVPVLYVTDPQRFRP